MGERTTGIEEFAAKLEAKYPSNPGQVSLETSMMLVTLSCGEDAVLENLRLALLRSDLGSVVRILAEANKHLEADLDLLQKSYDEGDNISLQCALRRMAGDYQAGQHDDEFKPFVGKGFVRRNAAGDLERLPLAEDRVVADGGREHGYYGNLICGWKAAFPHVTSYIVKPSLLPKEHDRTQMVACYNLGEEADWERVAQFNVIEANIANASADLLLGQMDPNSGSLVMAGGGVQS